MRAFLLLFLSAFFYSAADAQISLVADMAPGAPSSGPIQLTSFNGKLYFNAAVPGTGRELYAYDGSGAPTLVSDMTPGSSGFVHADIEEDMAVLNGVMYFAGSTPATGAELFRYSGSGAPTLAGGEIVPGASGSLPSCIRAIGPYIYFSAWTLGAGVELYRYDPTTNASARLTDLTSGPTNSSPTEITGYKGKIYFRASGDEALGELYAYDPAGDSAYLVADMNPGYLDHGTPKYLTVLGDTLYFAAMTPTVGAEIFAYSGSGAPVHRTNLAPGTASGVLMGGTSTAIGIIKYDSALYFIGADTGADYQLYRYSPATGQTTLAHRFNSSGSSLHLGAVHDGALYLAASTSAAGQELWRHTPGSTTMVADLLPGAGSGMPTSFCSWDGKLYFSATNGPSGLELFRLDALATVSAGAQNTGWRIFPNPAHECVHISWTALDDAPASAMIFDATGRCVQKATLAGSLQSADVSTTALPAGAYLLQVQRADGIFLIAEQFIKR